jgi:archaellum component FlaC
MALSEKPEHCRSNSPKDNRDIDRIFYLKEIATQLNRIADALEGKGKQSGSGDKPSGFLVDTELLNHPYVE